MRKAKKMENKVSKRKVERVQLREVLLVNSKLLKKKKVRCFSIETGLNPSHHNTF